MTSDEYKESVDFLCTEPKPSSDPLLREHHGYSIEQMLMKRSQIEGADEEPFLEYDQKLLKHQYYILLNFGVDVAFWLNLPK